MAVSTQFPKRGILNQFPGPHLAHLNNYAAHIRNFTGSVNWWDFFFFFGGEGARLSHFIMEQQ